MGTKLIDRFDQHDGLVHSQPLFVSGDTKASEVDTLRGHMNNEDDDDAVVDVDNIQNGDMSMVLDDEEAPEVNVEGGWELEYENSYLLVGDLVAAGNFETAMVLLVIQLGIGNFKPLRSLFMDLYIGSRAYLPSSYPASAPSIPLGDWNTSLVFNLFHLKQKLEAGKEATTTGKFSEALRLFLSILHTIPLIVVESLKDVDEAKEMIIAAKEYVMGLKMELKRRELKDNLVRQQELAAYFTHCNLDLPHLRLALMNAMIVCYKAGNLITASNFATRLLETHPTIENQMKTARSVMQAAQKKNMKDKMQLNYEFGNPFVVCAATYVPIYQGQEDVLCPYCSSHFVLSWKGQLCTVCDLAVVGADADGLLCSPAQIE